MTSGIHINVGGGSATFGNVVQGDHNTVGTGHVHGGAAAARFDKLVADLPALARPFDRPSDEVARLTHEIERLKREATAPEPDVARGGGIVAGIRKHFGWAWPTVKVLLEGTWPVVLTALVG